MYPYTQAGSLCVPIYEIFMMQNDGSTEEGTDQVWPQFGTTSTVGFYFDIEDAVEALHENSCDVRECVFNYAFVLARLPGLYDSVSVERRIFFSWDEEKKGFYETEEPENLKLLCF